MFFGKEIGIFKVSKKIKIVLKIIGLRKNIIYGVLSNWKLIGN